MRWVTFTAAAAVAAVIGLMWAFGRARPAWQRVAGLLVLIVAAAWVSGPGGAAIAAALSWAAARGKAALEGIPWPGGGPTAASSSPGTTTAASAGT